MIDQIKDHLAAVATIIGSLTLIIAVIIKRGLPVFRFMRNRVMFQSDMRTFIETTNNERAAFMECYHITAKRAEQSSQDISEIKDKINNGLSHKVAMLAAIQNQVTSIEAHPIFVCNETGENEAVSLGYLRLLGLTEGATDDTIKNINWKDATTGDLQGAYFEAFADAVRHRTGFIRSCGFQNPFTGEYRGEWRVSAPCTEVGSALIFTGRFIPMDESAKEIAQQYGWIS